MLEMPPVTVLPGVIASVSLPEAFAGRDQESVYTTALSDLTVADGYWLSSTPGPARDDTDRRRRASGIEVIRIADRPSSHS